MGDSCVNAIRVSFLYLARVIASFTAAAAAFMILLALLSTFPPDTEPSRDVAPSEAIDYSRESVESALIRRQAAGQIRFERLEHDFAEASQRNTCTTGDIELGKFHIRKERYSWSLVGEITNNCSKPTGVQLRFTMYTSDGMLIKSATFYPASTNNILPKIKFPVDYMETQDDVDHFNVTIEKVSMWGD
jgi:hypothetical protein